MTGTPKDPAGQEFKWVQPKVRERTFELRSEGDVVARLCFETASGSRATASSAAGRWTLKRVGFLNPRVTARADGENHDLAVFWPRFRGDGWLEFTGGNRFHWSPSGFWESSWGFADAENRLLFTVKPSSGKLQVTDLLKAQGVVEVSPAARSLPELPLLLTLGWYLMLLREDDAVAVTATTVAAFS